MSNAKKPNKPAKNEIENDEKSEETPIVQNPQNDKEIEVSSDVSSYNPLSESVKERPYTKPNVMVDATSAFTPIPEPSLTKPIISLQDELKKEEQPVQQEKKAPELINEGLSEMSEAEKQKSAETVVDMFLDVYGMLNAGGAKLAKIGDKQKRKISEKVPLDYNLQLSSTQSITLHQLIEKTNSDIDTVCTVDEKFKSKVKPPLVRIAVKKGLGLTDEQQVAYLFIKDIGEKTAVLYSLRSVIGNLVTQIEEQNILMRSGAAPQSTPPPASQFNNEQSEQKNDDDIMQQAPEPTLNDVIEDAEIINHTLVSEEKPTNSKRTRKNKAMGGMDALQIESGE